MFIFKFKDSSIKKFILDSNNNDEILELCCEFANAKFSSINDMLLDNDFYRANIRIKL